MTRDQFISSMMGMSWSPNDPADILELQRFVMAEYWWCEFFDDYLGCEPVCEYVQWLFSDPDRFATLVAEFRGWKE